jgi:hypothetical protein
MIRCVDTVWRFARSVRCPLIKRDAWRQAVYNIWEVTTREPILKYIRVLVLAI